MRKDIIKNITILVIIYILMFNLINIKEAKAETDGKNKESTVASNTISTTDQNNYKAIKTELKSGVRKLFENMNKNLPKEDFGKLKCCAYYMLSGSHSFRQHVLHYWLCL